MDDAIQWRIKNGGRILKWGCGLGFLFGFVVSFLIPAPSGTAINPQYEISNAIAAGLGMGCAFAWIVGLFCVPVGFMRRYMWLGIAAVVGFLTFLGWLAGQGGFRGGW